MMLVALFVVACGASPPSDAGAVDAGPLPRVLRVLPIGDSYTVGYPGEGGWRAHVEGVEFVGPFRDSAGAFAAVNGRRLATLVHEAPTWIAAYPADVVVVWAGYNDLDDGTTPAATAALMAEMVAEGDGARVVVCTTPVPSNDLADAVRAYDDALRARGWTLADVDAVTREDIGPDGVHLTARGYEAAGRVIAEAIVGR